MHKRPCSIVISTFGEEKWHNLARERALPAAERQEGCEIILHHDPEGTAASARNGGVARATREWIVICDADDELEPGYVDACLAGGLDLRFPRVRYIPFAHDFERNSLPDPVILTKRTLLMGNYMVIGTMMQKALFEKVGGLSEFESWEDWYLFLQLTYLGARPRLVPEAIYRIYQTPGSRVSVVDSQGLFNHMLNEFRFWALSFNGGVTEDREYNIFLRQPNKYLL